MPLSHYVKIFSGHPFRREIHPGKGLNVIQMRDISDQLTVDWSSVTETSPTSQRKPHWLCEDDILVAGCGNHYYAVLLDAINKPSVASPHFFVLRILDKNRVSPHYLAFALNQRGVQHYLYSHASGRASRNIRRDVLANTPIPIPSLARQLQILQLASTLDRQRNQLSRIIEDYRRSMNLLFEESSNDPISPLREACQHAIQALAQFDTQLVSYAQQFQGIRETSSSYHENPPYISTTLAEEAVGYIVTKSTRAKNSVATFAIH